MRLRRVLLLLGGICVLVGCRGKTVGIADNPTSTRDEMHRSGACVDVTFSISNQDRLAPVVMTDILMDSEVVFHGPITHSHRGDYVYVQTHVHRKKVNLEVQSKTPEGTLVREKNLWVGDRAWIVISRVRGLELAPELEIVVSYENPNSSIPK